MNTSNSSEIALYCASGIIQHSESVEAMLAEYNRNGRFYEIRADEKGRKILWHKGQRRNCGVFKASERV